MNRLNRRRLAIIGILVTLLLLGLFASPMSRGDDYSGWWNFSDDGVTQTQSPVKYDNNPLFDNAVMPYVIKNESDYWMYYGDVTAGLIMRRIGTDEVTWGEGSSTGIVSKYCSVWKDGPTWRMIYANLVLTELRLATSVDGLSFVDQGVVVSLGPSGTFDDFEVSDPSEMRFGSTYYLYYVGNDGSVIGLATSSTGAAGSYTRQGVVKEPSVSGWDNVALFDPFILEYDTGKWMLMYSAHGDGVQRIGYATTTDLDSCNFTSGAPIIWAGTQGWENPDIINEQTVLVEDNRYKVWYRGSGYHNGEIGYLCLIQDETTKLPMAGEDWQTHEGNLVIAQLFISAYILGMVSIFIKSRGDT